jgi:hypothetical protein
MLPLVAAIGAPVSSASQQLAMLVLLGYMTQPRILGIAAVRLPSSGSRSGTGRHMILRLYTLSVLPDFCQMMLDSRLFNGH